MAIKASIVFTLCLLAYQVFSLSTSPIKPQMPVLSHIISIILASTLSGPVYKETLTHTSAQYGLTEPCPPFGVCSGGLLVSCASGYQKSPFNNSFYPHISFVSIRNFYNAIGNSAMARWMPTAYRRMNEAISQGTSHGDADRHGLSQTFYSYDFLTRPPILQRRMRCQRANAVTNKLFSLLQALDYELQAHKGDLFCRSRGRKITLNTSLPLLETRTIKNFIRINSLYFSTVHQHDTDGVLTADSINDLITVRRDILQNDVLEVLTQVIMRQDTDMEAFLPPNIKFRLPIDPSEIVDTVPCDPYETEQKCMHRRYVYILENTNAYTQSLPKFNAVCKFRFWFQRDPATALGKILQGGAFTFGSFYVLLNLSMYVASEYIARQIKGHLHDYKVGLLQKMKPADTETPGFAAVTMIQLRDLFMSPYPYIIRKQLWNGVLRNIRADSRITITSGIDLTGRSAEFVVWNGLLRPSGDAKPGAGYFKNHVTPVALPPPSEDHD